MLPIPILIPIPDVTWSTFGDWQAIHKHNTVTIKCCTFLYRRLSDAHYLGLLSQQVVCAEGDTRHRWAGYLTGHPWACVGNWTGSTVSTFSCLRQSITWVSSPLCEAVRGAAAQCTQTGANSQTLCVLSVQSLFDDCITDNLLKRL